MSSFFPAEKQQRTMQTFVASRKYLVLVCMLHRKQVILLYEELTLYVVMLQNTWLHIVLLLGFVEGL